MWSYSDPRFGHTEEIYARLVRFGRRWSRFLNTAGSSPEDFAQDAFVHMLRRKGFERFDPRKCRGGLAGYVSSIAKSTLRDILRTRWSEKRSVDPYGRPVSVCSLNAPLSGQSTEFGDRLFAAFGTGAHPNEALLILEILDAIPDTPCVRGRDNTWFDLLNDSADYEPREIARRWSEQSGRRIGTARIVQLQRELREIIRAAAAA